MSNRLALETSPYLLQHKDNAVDWYPWGPEALTRARAEQKPIFLSIGYAACHWCHVMEHESFDNPEIAAFLNARFISIKVDREERPDLDQIYMTAVQVMTRHGGWPMSVFLTPDLQPFYGGTYWPPYPRMGMPGFIQVIQGVDELWRTRRDEAVQQAAQLTQYLQRSDVPDPDDAAVGQRLFQEAVAQLEREFDAVHGGFGFKPKFPHAMALQFLLRMWRRTGRDGLLKMVRLNLDKMACGGIYDHLGGGFARYAVDERWLVPHFEKMLYDNALLAGTYLDAYLATGDGEYRPRGPGDAGLRVELHDRRGRRLSQFRRRRQRRRGGQVLRLDAGGDRAGPRPRARRAVLLRVRRDGGRQFREPQHPQSAQDDPTVCGS